MPSASLVAPTPAFPVSLLSTSPGNNNNGGSTSSNNNNNGAPDARPCSSAGCISRWRADRASSSFREQQQQWSVSGSYSKVSVERSRGARADRASPPSSRRQAAPTPTEAATTGVRDVLAPISLDLPIHSESFAGLIPWNRSPSLAHARQQQRRSVLSQSVPVLPRSAQNQSLTGPWW